ncbi:hypothetical protein C8J57DRAFT_1259271 [Mycena rebaudengoi]|nr:hypothetical protein C8J57DRAFT_1259271 [Mycena rebaudengoi]
MSKLHGRHSKANNYDSTFSPSPPEVYQVSHLSERAPKEEQAERHRVAVPTHYQKAEKQLRRRQWDPPKKTVPDPPHTIQSDDSKSQPAQTESSNVRTPPVVRFQDIRCLSSDESLNGIPRDPDPASEPEAAPGTIVSQYSRTSAEIAATGALLALNHSNIQNTPEFLDNLTLRKHVPPLNAERHVTEESVLGVALMQGSQRDAVGAVTGLQITLPLPLPAPNPERVREITWSWDDQRHLKPGMLPAGVAPLMLMQKINLERTGYVGRLSHVQAAQVRVSEINSGPLTQPTADDTISWTLVRKWIWKVFGPTVGMLDEGNSYLVAGR